MILVLALLVCGALLAALPRRQHVPYVRPVETVSEADLGLLRRLRVPLAGACVAAVWVVVGGPAGLVGGAAAALAAWRVLSRGEGPAAQRRRRDLEQDMPFAVHLLGACLRSGAAIESSLDAVALALGGPVGEEFRRLRARLTLGSDPAVVWADLAAEGPLAPLGHALARAHRSGSSVSAAVDRLSEDLRTETLRRAQSRARTIEVRAAAPLGLCLLPAFLLLGVVPLTVGAFRSLDFFG